MSVESELYESVRFSRCLINQTANNEHVTSVTVDVMPQAAPFHTVYDVLAAQAHCFTASQCRKCYSIQTLAVNRGKRRTDRLQRSFYTCCIAEA